MNNLSQDLDRADHSEELVRFREAVLKFNEAGYELDYENPANPAATRARYDEARKEIESIFYINKERIYVDKEQS